MLQTTRLNSTNNAKTNVVCSGNSNAAAAQFSSFRRLIPGDIFIQLTQIFHCNRFIDCCKQILPNVTHIQNGLNIVQLNARNIDAVQNRSGLRKCNGPVFHFHSAVHVFFPFVLGEKNALFRRQVEFVRKFHCIIHCTS